LICFMIDSYVHSSSFLKNMELVPSLKNMELVPSLKNMEGIHLRH